MDCVWGSSVDCGAQSTQAIVVLRAHNTKVIPVTAPLLAVFFCLHFAVLHAWCVGASAPSSDFVFASSFPVEK